MLLCSFSFSLLNVTLFPNCLSLCTKFVIVIIPTALEGNLTLFLDWLCVGDLLCRDVTDKEKGGSKPLSSVMHFPFDSAAATESNLQHFSPWTLCSVFSCGMCWRTVNCKNLISLILFSLFTFVLQ